MTEEKLLQLARAKWGTAEGRKSLTARLECGPSYVSHILRGARRMPDWMLEELGLERVVTVTYTKKGK